MTTQALEKRPMGALGRMSIVAGMHVAAFYLIASSLGIVPPLVEVAPPDIRIIEQPEPPDPPPTIPQPQQYDPTVYVPTPEPVPTEPAETDTRVAAVVNDHPPIIQEVVPPARTLQLTGVRMDSRHPLSQPAYPLSDIRQGNEGTAEIEVYVLPSGRIGDVRVIKSAGSPTLDQSAIDEAKRKWRMLPAMRDGEPYAQWHRLKVTFNLKNR
jgi:protein TonB